jgi:hypothetical protein
MPKSQFTKPIFAGIFNRSNRTGFLYRLSIMALTLEQRAELETLGSGTVRTKLIQPGHGAGAALQGFKTAPLGLTRSDVEDWLAEQHTKEEQRERSILFWARLAGIVAIIGVAATIGTAIWHR